MTVNNAEPETPGERLPLGYGRIRRGPMAADAFTQIRNAVFRDVRLSAKAMGIFGNISTHRDGWGVSAESIAAQMKDGVAAVKGGLRELEQYGYLQRTQVRRADGTLGGAVYFITDQPDALPQQPEPPELPQSPRSEPSVENRPAVVTSDDAQNRRSEPSVDYPPADKPPAENRQHKNTNPKSTKSKNTLSPRLPEQTAQEPPAAQGEREIDPLVQKLMNDHDATEDEATSLLSQVRAEGRINSVASWASSATGQLDIKQRLYEIRTPQRLGPSAPSLSPWCGECNDGDPAAVTDPARRFHHTDEGSRRCACHPASQKAA